MYLFAPYKEEFLEDMPGNRKIDGIKIYKEVYLNG